MKRFLPSTVWTAFALAAVAAASAASCGDSESTNPISTASSSGSGASGGTGGTSSTGGNGGTGGAGGSGGVQIPGLSAPVEALYDQYGAVHLACKTDDDCYAALGYMHASNRFFFMDFVRNSVRGSLASLVKAGDPVLSQDYQNRQFFTTKDGDPLEKALYDQASAPVRAIMDSYTKGVNAWLADMRAGKNGATLTDEYDFALIVKSAIRDWEPEDSAAVGLYVLNDLSDDSSSEIAAGATIPLFGSSALAADLFSTEGVFDAFTIPAANQPPPAFHSPIAPEAIARLAPHHALLSSAGEALRRLIGRENGPKHIDARGSNNWVAGPGRSASQHALLANDPHLLLSNPSIWFPVEIDAKSNGGTGVYHVEGSTFPGLPSVMIGHNESIAWGVTTAYYDLDDVYLESLTADNNSVNYNGGTTKLTTKTYKFADAKSGKTLTKSFKWVPHHGPLVSEDDAAHTGVSIRWRGHDGGQDLDAFFGLARAKDMADAKSKLQVASSANQNFVVIDGAGNIGWFPYAKVPSRPWASPSLPPWLPLPGDGTAEWGDPVPYANLPQLENPALGAIATANNDMTGAWADGDPFNDGVPALQSAYKADGTREQRILDMLNDGGNTHSVDTFSAMQGDTHSLYGEFVVAALKAAIDPATLPADQKAVFDALTAWKFTCPTGLQGDDPKSAKSTDASESAESIGCSAFHVTFYAIVEQAIGDEIKAAGATDFGYGEQLVARALAKPASVVSGDLLWDDVATTGIVETKNDILLRAIARATTVLATIGAPDDWRWGAIHTLSLQSIYANFGIATYNYGPYAAPGGLFTVNVADPNNETLAMPAAVPNFAFTSGPSIRFLVEETDAGPKMKFQLPGGEDLHRDSKFYNNMLPRWLHNQPVDFAFGPGAVTKPAKTVEIFPKG